MKIFFKPLIFTIKLVFSRYYYSNYKERYGKEEEG